MHPTWALDREKNSQGHNVRRHVNQLHEFLEDDRLLIKSMNDQFICDTLREMQDYYEWMDSSMNRFCSTLSTTFKVLIKHKLVDRLPYVPRKPEPFGRTEWYTKAQVEALADYAYYREQGDRLLGDLILFTAYTGLRSQEIRKLKKRDFDVRNGSPIIHVGGTADTATKTHGTKSGYRTVELPERIHEIAFQLIEGKEPMQKIFGERFANRQQIIRPFNRVKEAVRAMTRDETITDDHVFHTLRHTYGTWRIAAGADLMDVKFAMGHSTVAMTERYIHNTHGSFRTGPVKI